MRSCKQQGRINQVRQKQQLTASESSALQMAMMAMARSLGTAGQTFLCRPDPVVSEKAHAGAVSNTQHGLVGCYYHGGLCSAMIALWQNCWPHQLLSVKLLQLPLQYCVQPSIQTTAMRLSAKPCHTFSIEHEG